MVKQVFLSGWRHVSMPVALTALVIGAALAFAYS